MIEKMLDEWFEKKSSFSVEGLGVVRQLEEINKVKQSILTHVRKLEEQIKIESNQRQVEEDLKKSFIKEFNEATIRIVRLEKQNEMLKVDLEFEREFPCTRKELVERISYYHKQNSRYREAITLLSAHIDDLEKEVDCPNHRLMKMKTIARKVLNKEDTTPSQSAEELTDPHAHLRTSHKPRQSAEQGKERENEN